MAKAPEQPPGKPEAFEPGSELWLLAEEIRNSPDGLTEEQRKHEAPYLADLALL